MEDLLILQEGPRFCREGSFHSIPGTGKVEAENSCSLFNCSFVPPKGQECFPASEGHEDTVTALSPVQASAGFQDAFLRKVPLQGGSLGTGWSFLQSSFIINKSRELVLYLADSAFGSLNWFWLGGVAGSW